MKRSKRKERCVPRWVPPVILAAFILVILSAGARRSYALADFVNSYVATPLRVVMSAISNYIPFSVFELIFILAIPALLCAITVSLVRDGSLAAKIRRLLSIVGVVGILFSGYLAVMTIPYNTTPLSSRLSIDEDTDIEVDELYSATLLVRDKINELAPTLQIADGVTVMPYTHKELSQRVCDAYESVSAEYPFFYNFDSQAKDIAFSGIMSDMGISGIYTYLTGEANVNTSYPDYCYVFTVAHEFAHQRGINRENEANFMAFFVLSRSGDPYLAYSAYLNLYEYLASALYSSDKQLYAELSRELSDVARADNKRASEITREHRDSPLYKLMHNVNDAYLKSNGTEGVVSYGYVVRIAVGYLNSSTE